MLPLPRLVPRAQCREHSDCSPHPGGQVSYCNTYAYRAAFFRSSDTHEAGVTLGDLIESGQIAKTPLLAESERCVDEAGALLWQSS